jgi:hypothetical protein
LGVGSSCGIPWNVTQVRIGRNSKEVTKKERVIMAKW